MLSFRDKNMESFRMRYGGELPYSDPVLDDEIQNNKESYCTLIATGQARIRFEIPDVIRLCYVEGIGDGSFIRQLFEKLPAETEYIVYEPAMSCFLYICDKYDISDIICNEKVFIVVGDIDTLRNVSESKTTLTNMHTRGMVCTPGYRETYPEDCAQIEGIIRDFKDTWGFRAELQCRNELYALAQLGKNYLAKDLFDNIPTRDIPIIIAAAGPSLKKNISQLKGLHDRAIIVAVSHAAKTMEMAGIHPHFYAETDPALNNAFLKLEDTDNIRIIMKPSAASDKQRSYCGRCFYFGFDGEAFFGFKNRVNDKNYNCGGSVATDVFDFFASSGYKKIILIGQDLAYDDEGHSHVDQDINAHGYADGITEDIYGNPIKTRSDWMMFIRVYEKLIDLHPGVRVIDATEGGAKIRGTDIKTLKECIAEYCSETYPVDEWLGGTLTVTEKYGENVGSDALKELYADTQQVMKLVSEANLWGERAIAAEDEGMETDWFRTVLGRYDQCFQQILKDKKNALLCLYCGDVVKQFVSRYSQLDKSGNYIDRRLKFEKDFLTKLLEQGAQMLAYMEELIG